MYTKLYLSIPDKDTFSIPYIDKLSLCHIGKNVLSIQYIDNFSIFRNLSISGMSKIILIILNIDRIIFILHMKKHDL